MLGCSGGGGGTGTGMIGCDWLSGGGGVAPGSRPPEVGGGSCIRSASIPISVGVEWAPNSEEEGGIDGGSDPPV